MQTTLDHAGTRVAQATEAGVFLRNSLIKLGTDSTVIAENLSLIRILSTVVPPTRSPGDRAGVDVQTAPPTPVPRAIVTPPVVTPQPTATKSGPRLQDVVMSSGVNNLDCAIDVNPRFTPDFVAIYVVARAYSVPAGATITSNWQRRGYRGCALQFRERIRNQRQLHLVLHRSNGYAIPGRILERGNPRRRGFRDIAGCFPNRRELMPATLDRVDNSPSPTLS